MTSPTEDGLRTRMRHNDRQKTDETWITDFLTKAHWGTVAMAHGLQPFVNMNLFAYDVARHAIYIHNARSGRTPSVIAENPNVCFSAGYMGRLLPADEAIEFSVEYAGVTVFGKATLVTSEDEARHGLQLLMDKYFAHLTPGEDYRPMQPEEIKRTAVFRIDIEEWTGKCKREADEFPGAFHYEQNDGWRK